jgi:ribosomal protein S12 methylthiotransferase
VLDEARSLVASGVLELNLIAEDTNQYGQDRRDGRGLAELLRALSELQGLRWIRILYAYPSYFTEELVQEIADNPKASETAPPLPARLACCPPPPRLAGQPLASLSLPFRACTS